MSAATALHRPARPALALTIVLLTVGSASATLAKEAPSGEPLEVLASPAAEASPMAVASAAASPSAVSSPLATAYLPLPTMVAAVPSDVPTVSVPPESEPGLVVGTSIAYSLEHCGLLSPVDLDGSVWRPVGGLSASGGAIETDAETGELINATPGEFVLLTPDTAEWRSVTGVVVGFERAAGALDYPLCM